MHTSAASRSLAAWKWVRFLTTFTLFCITAAGYIYAKPPADANNAPTALSDELLGDQLYYKQLTFAANEMNNQLSEWRQSYPNHRQLTKDKAYVDSLMSALGDAPEELSVTKHIVENLYAAYASVHNELLKGTSANYNGAEYHYAQFLANAIVIQNFNKYTGVDVICH